MSEIDSEEEMRFETACRFVIKLGTLTHGYGPQARRLESYLSRVIRSLGYNGLFSSTPNNITFTFIKNDELWHRTHLVSMAGTGFNLAKLAKVGELVRAVEEHKITIAEATDILDEIDKMPPPYGRSIVATGYALCGAGFAGFLQGSWWDIILSTILSLVVFFIVTVTEHASERVSLWVPFLCALVAAVITATINTLLPGIQAYLITLSAIIYLIPGFSISMGVLELTTRHVLSGICNLMNGLITLVLLFAGAWVGISVIRILLPIHSTQDTSVDSGLVWLFAMLLAAGLCIVFQTPPRDLVWALTACAIAYTGILLGERILGSNLGNFFGSACAFIFSNIWSEKTNRPTSIVLLPSVVFLVSGSIGFRGLVAMSAGNTVLGAHEFIHMFVVASAITIGLVVGNTVYKPKTTL